MICLACNKNSIDGQTHPGCRTKSTIDGAFCAVAYKGVVKKLIYNFKYKPYLADLKNSLVELFYESLIQQEIFQKVYQLKPVLVPIPLHAKRLRKRGYNHAELLSEGLAKKLKLETKDLLLRKKETKSQFGLKLKERKENLKDAFMINPGQKAPAENIILIDDILTTGSTLFEAARLLKKNGVRRVWGVTLSRD
jgi:ComF family protein